MTWRQFNYYPVDRGLVSRPTSLRDSGMEQGSRRLQYLTAFCVSIAAVSSGVAMNWNTAVIPKFHDNETNIQITDSQISWLASISSPGFVTGSIITSFTADKYGRRATLLGSALPTTVGAILLAISANVWMLYFGKYLWGVGSGAISTVSSTYLAEISDKDIRGHLTVMTRYMTYLGCFLVLAIGPIVSYRALNYMALVLPISYFITCWTVPETPYFYLKEGKVEKARKALQRLTKCKDEEVLEGRLSQMRSDVKKEMSRSGSIKELFTGRQYRKAVIIVIGLKFTQITSGSNAIAQYLGRITQESKSTLSVATVLVIFGAVRFILAVMSSLLVDRVGRRPLLIYSYLGSGLALAVVGAYFFKEEVIGWDTKPFGLYVFVPFLGILIQSIISCLGFQSVTYLIPAELFPLNVKSLAMTLSNIFGGLLNFGTVKSYQPLKDATGLCGVFWFYGAVSLFGAVFSFYFMPETKGKSLREIQVELQGNIYDETAENLNTSEDKEMVELGGIQTHQKKDG